MLFKQLSNVARNLTFAMAFIVIKIYYTYTDTYTDICRINLYSIVISGLTIICLFYMRINIYNTKYL